MRRPVTPCLPICLFRSGDGGFSVANVALNLRQYTVGIGKQQAIRATFSEIPEIVNYIARKCMISFATIRLRENTSGLEFGLVPRFRPGLDKEWIQFFDRSVYQS